MPGCQNLDTHVIVADKPCCVEAPSVPRVLGQLWRTLEPMSAFPLDLQEKGLQCRQMGLLVQK